MGRHAGWPVFLLGWAVAAAATGCGSAVTGSNAPGMGSLDGESAPPPRDASGVASTSAEAPPGPVEQAAWNGAASSAAGPLQVLTDPGELPQLKLATAPERKLPLEHTRVTAELRGFVAEVEVSQTYGNPFDEAIEAVYVFPLPENSAVHHMRMVIGERHIDAQIEQRQRAKRIYQQAKRAGYTAALLEQERPNVFTQSVANIEPGKKIDVIIRYVQDLTYDAGQYEFVFPMVVGPRFMPGGRLGGAPSGTGTHTDTSRVPDGARVSPPIVGKGQRSGHDISIEVLADTGMLVGGVQVPTHQVETADAGDDRVRVRLAARDSLPNRDFVMRYRVADEQPKATLFASPEGPRGGFFSLVVHPPALDVDQLVGQREIIFVVDVSGSMSGTPLGLCQSAMRQAIGRLRPVDTFNILTFSGGTQAAFATPRPANRSNVARALAVVDGMQARGGTHMADAVSAALATDVAAGRHRYVFFLTDGYVGNEGEIIAASAQFVQALGARKQRARVFGFGVGSSVNRYLIDGLSRAGRGVAVYATTREDPARAVNRFFHYIDRAVLTGLRVDWGGLATREVLPHAPPDLFASHAVVMHGRYRGSMGGTMVVRALAGDREIALPVTVRRAEAAGNAYDVQAALWARTKITSLEEHLWDGAVAAVEREITQLGLEYHLVTRFTSFVAVDRSRRVSGGDPKRVVQPVAAPDGVDVEAAGGVRVDGAQPGRAPELRLQRSLAGQAGPSPTQAPADDFAEAEESVHYASEESLEPPPAPADTADFEVDMKRGCGCRVVGALSPPGRVHWAWLCLLAATVLRRRVGRGRGSRRCRRRPNGDLIGSDR